MIANSKRQLGDEKFTGPRAGARDRNAAAEAGRVRSAARRRIKEALGDVIDHPDIRALVKLALDEDIGTGDVTTLACVPAGPAWPRAVLSPGRMQCWRESNCCS